jgi:hypothetical protein
VVESVYSAVRTDCLYKQITIRLQKVNIMGLSFYIRFVVDRKVVMQRIPVYI